MYLLILLTVLALQVKSQNYVEIGSGTVSNTMPVYSSWNYSWSSLIYNHADLGSAKSIIKIALNCTNGPKTVTNQKIYFKLTPNTVYASANYEDPLNNGYTLVFQGNLTFVTGWNEITLLSPIPYDGVQNISIHWENRWGTSYGPNFNSTSSSINNNKNCGNDQNFPLPSQTGYLNPYPSSLTNMRFYYNGTGPVTPTNPVPADNATVVSVSTSLSWQLGANTTSYDLWLGTDPLNLSLVVSNAPVAGAGTYSYTPPTLLADSTWHYWKVIAKNATQQESSPVWKFKTEVVIDQFPYYQGFEDSTVFNTYPVQSAWVITPDVSWYQYNAQQHSGQLCAKSSWYTAGNEAILRSPKVLLPASYTISFYWRNTTANKIAIHDTTYFEVTGNGGQTWVKVDTLAPATGNAAYIQRIHSLNAFAGNNCFFRFRHRTDNSSGAANVYLDDISIYQTGGLPTLAVTPPNQNVTPPAGSTQFTVSTTVAWTAVSDQTWCTVTPAGTGNGTISANYTQNSTASQRIANVTVTVAGISPVTVTVTQSASAPTLAVSPPNQNVTSPAGSTQFTVTTSAAWTAVSDQTWCTVTPAGTGNGTITANYLANTTTSQRIANVTVTIPGIAPVVVTVTQGIQAPSLSVSPPNQNVTAPAGTTSFTVTSNSSWTSASNQPWCIVTNAGSGNGTITANYTLNPDVAPRVATITVTVAGLSPVTVTVTQDGAAPILAVTPPVQNVTCQPGTAGFTVTANLTWTATSDASWCVPTPSGSGNGTLVATYQQNVAAQNRTANITVSAAGIAPVVVQVVQLAPVGIGELDKPGLTVYPNPATGLIRINFGSLDTRDGSVQIINARGTVVMQQKIGSDEMQLDLSTFEKGVYLLIFKGNNAVASEKIIVK